jgi:hypothetical protein
MLRAATLAAVSVALLAALPAEASVISRNGPILVLKAERGERNEVRASELTGAESPTGVHAVVVRDRHNALAAEPLARCVRSSAGALACSLRGIDKLSLRLGDGDDRATLGGRAAGGLDLATDGGAGADQLFAATSGAVEIAAGSGNDAVGAQIGGEFSSVTVSGNGGDDWLVNLGGSRIGIATFSGNQGNDTVIGSEFEDDVLDGGPGSDVLVGLGGIDALLARDGEADQLIACDESDPATPVAAGASDRAILDSADPEPSGCETIDRA